MARKKEKYLILNLESAEFEMVDSVGEAEAVLSSMATDEEWDEDDLKEIIKIYKITDLKECTFTTYVTREVNLR